VDNTPPWDFYNNCALPDELVRIAIYNPSLCPVEFSHDFIAAMNSYAEPRAGAGIWLLMLCLVLAPTGGRASTKTWDGTSSGNWGTAANWAGGVAPISGDDLVFPTGVTRFTITNNIGLLPLGSLTFTGSNYVMRGVGILLTNGIKASHVSKTNSIQLPVTINSNQTFTVTSGGELEILGDVVLNGFDLIVSNSTSARLDGVLSGSGGLIKVATGTLTLSGTNANTFSGGTTVAGGTLALDKAVNNGAVPSDLTIGSAVAAVLVRHLRSDQIANNAIVTILAQGTLDLNGVTDIIGGLIMSGGSLAESGSGAIHLNGNLTVNASASPATITGELGFFGTTLRTFNVNPGPSATSNLLIHAHVTGPAGFTKTGAGQVVLTASNSYSGLTVINAGSIRVAAPFGLGTNTVGTVLNGGGLFIEGVNVTTEPLTNNSFFSALFGSATLASSYAGDIVLNTNLAIFTSSNALLTLSGRISGSGGVIKTGPGPLRFSGTSTNTYAGATTVRGTLELAKSGGVTALPGDVSIGDGSQNPNRDVVRCFTEFQISSSSDVLIDTSGLLDLNNHQASVGSISGGGNIIIGNGPLAVVGASGTNLFSGSISGSGALTKLGGATLILSGSNSYSGTTVINGGIVQIDGVQPNSPIQVNGGKRLQGSGIVGNLSGNGSAYVFAPGASPGILTCSNFSCTGSGFLEIELNGTSPGFGYDQLNARGNVNLTGITLNLSLNFPSGLSNQFVIVNNDGADPVSGNFSGRLEGTTISAGGESFRISYAGGDGNDVVLTQTSGVLHPSLNIIGADSNAVAIFWSTNTAGFNLESNTNLADTNWLPVSPAPTLLGSNFVVTNSTAVSPNFYRLRK
jgi:fibronectin-binding autotransporter adhesin